MFLLTLSVALSAFSQTRAVNRISQAIDDRDTISLRGNVHPMLQKATDQGRMDGNTKLEGVSLVFKRTAEQDAAVEKLLADQQNPNSPSYHKWLTPEQYADRFGVSAVDMNKVASWLQSQGFAVNRTARGRTQVWFSGTVSQIETVFRTEMHRYTVNGEAHFANSVEPSVPSALGDLVLGVHSLSNFRPKPRVRMNRAVAETIKPNFTSSSGLHFLTPDDWTTIYDVKALYTAGFDGTGQTIAIAGQSDVNNADIDAFRTAAGLPARTAGNFVRKQVPNSGTATVVSGDVGESSIDLEWAQGVAKGANEVFVFTGKSVTSSANVFDAFTYAIDQNLAPILSMSYGNCEQNLPSAFLSSVVLLTQQASMQGQTIAAASGDFGAADCDIAPQLPAQGGLGVDIPGALPYVTSVGGTAFNGDLSSPATFWNSTNNTFNGSAKAYIGETTWNDTTLLSLLSAGGGGASTLFAKPSWQTGTGVPSDGRRDVPDIALAAGPNHDGYMLCVTDPGSSPAQLPCSSGFLDSTGRPDIAGGTSFGAPTFAGIVAILLQKTGSHQGTVNPGLYAMSAANVGAFHDITTGNNIVPCDPATIDCPTSGTAQYGCSAGVGYDQVTGLGSIDAAALVNNWGTVNPAAADFTMFGSLVGIAAPGGNGSSTITVDAKNGYSGTITFTCTPPTSAKIGCTVSGSPLTLGSGTTSGTVTVSITTAAAALTPGSAPLWLGGSGAIFAGVLLFGTPLRRRKLTVALTIITIALVLSAVGCGGSSSSSGGGNTGTLAGTYTVSVTGTDGTTSHTTNVAVAVK
ncbi:MAG TPA: S53 family peptidase [Terriglobales bacterium]|nr:S53 family peptidase [Terriglobales bacterium]